MANETILRNGLIAKAASEIEGILGVQGLQMLNGSNVVQYTFPTADSTGNSGYALVTNGSGSLSFAAPPDLSVYLEDITGESIGSLSDVTITSAQSTQVLQYNGSAWVNVAANTVGVTNLADLTDTTITSAANGDFLRHNGTAWVDSAIQNSDIVEAMVTQHQASLSIAIGQVTGFTPGDYLTTATAATTYIPLSQKGANSGVATLDASGLVPSTQLPSYVDDVIEFDQPLTTAGSPVVGDLPSGETESTGKIYVDTASNEVYRWSGSAFVNITDFAAPDHNISTHGDVTISAIDTNEVLQWSGSEWQNQTLAELGMSVDDLSDVDLGGDTAEDKVLAFNSSGILVPTSVGDLSTSDSVSTLEDVTLDALGAGELLVSVGSAAWENKTISEAGLATSAQGALADSAVQPADITNMLETTDSVTDLSDVTNIGSNGNIIVNSSGNLVGVSTISHDSITNFDTEVNDLIAAATLGDLTSGSITDLDEVTTVGSAGDVLVSNGTNLIATAAALYERTSVTPGADAATAVITEALVGAYVAVTVEYSISDGTNMRMGQIMAITDGTDVELTDISTASIGSEADEPVFSATTGSNLVIKVGDASGYTVKTAHFVVNA